MKLRQIRESKNLSQSELANKMGVDQSAVAQWETNRTMPTYSNLIKLCKVLGCSISELTESAEEIA